MSDRLIASPPLSAAKPSSGPRQFAAEDYAQLMSHPVGVTDAWLPTEGVTQVWYITKGGNKNVTLQEKERGHFFSAECYLVLHVFSDQVRVPPHHCLLSLSHPLPVV